MLEAQYSGVCMFFRMEIIMAFQINRNGLINGYQKIWLEMDIRKTFSGILAASGFSKAHIRD